MDDEACMRRALELARRGQRTCTPNPMVGCVIAKDGEVVAEGWHAKAGGPHAEAVALEQAGAAAAGATVYVTLEPCAHQGRTPPCTAALAAARPARLVAAARDPNPQVDGQGLAALQEAGIACEEGLLADDARALNRGFFQRMEKGRPWVTLKTAMTLDGRSALADGASKWLTGPAARRRVHEMRAASCAVLTGCGTALADDPLLTARDVDAPRQPRRFLLDAELRSAGKGLRLLEDELVIATAKPRPADLPAHVELLDVELADGKADLAALLRAMAARWEINELLLECGARLAGAFVKADLVDEIKLFVAPKYLGAGLASCDFAGVAKIADAPGYRFAGVELIEDDALLSMERAA
ncbi:MAG: bifunctional diaminohydroxyphosphoribosylaminopyrimidine deaminase/5-amino-6-(5-phosphoribosylamino)uracil reductase RibD [Betaproteobacteria bacterium AqS2]|uniref:Riboflavin biosynthesis protein RibD n=1 Tax=Candidatus Amphirhobacter heronislandensis TaxID=1732024 RepID=A0A930UBB8_9GAMM|nr:bifunctional diaminohydroxyphosphoribosylaminopyrimidine deaminase/5-amino-6-(5-phosphoribosylamino)uracil reductase RibD [Betaproteobacteria bacterium AqS2]